MTSHSQARRVRWRIGASLVVMTLLLFIRCATGSLPPIVDPLIEGEYIIVADQKIPTGTRVVTWQEPGGYSAYLEGKHFDPNTPPDGKRRYSSRRGNPQTLEDLQQTVSKFVVHYDMCGCSRQCFKVLQDVRKLSVHFMLDVDGTIYQTLDVREKAWHATIANDTAIGIEIAHAGAWLRPLNADMRRWYAKDDQGWYQKFPKWMPVTDVRTPNFVARPDRPEFVSGKVQGKTYHQFDFTPEQYRALPKLMAALNKALPRIRLDAPRHSSGTIVDRALSESAFRDFEGVLGHFHVQTNKQDPGPAFQWERMLRDARQNNR